MNNEDTKWKLGELIDLGLEKFDSWECDFISDMVDRSIFTDKQAEKIEELYKKHCE